jgi:arylsulfatase A-like enzyme
MPQTVGVTGNQDALDSEYRDQTVGRVLSDAGYTAGYAGKWHVPELAVQDGFGFERLCGFDDTAVVDACSSFLHRDHEDPFLLVASFDDPHNICEWSRDQMLPWGNVDRVPTEECPTLPANFHPPAFEPAEIRPAIEQNRYVHGAMVDASPEEWRQYRHAYYRLVERVDARIERILDELERAGQYDDTLVVFTSDHGDGNGAHQLKEKTWLYEEQTRVPLIVSPPPAADGDQGLGRVDDAHLVSNGLDLLPTLCDYAGVEPPAGLPGASLRPLVDGAEPDWREQLVVQTSGPIDGRMLRTDRYKYVVYTHGDHREQLFDLRADPGEMVDLATDADHADVLADHRERLVEWCIETADMFGSFNDYPAVPRVPGYEYRELRERVENAGDRSPPGRIEQ